VPISNNVVWNIFSSTKFIVQIAPAPTLNRINYQQDTSLIDLFNPYNQFYILSSALAQAFPEQAHQAIVNRLITGHADGSYDSVPNSAMTHISA
jgi:hypothetical protein